MEPIDFQPAVSDDATASTDAPDVTASPETGDETTSDATPDETTDGEAQVETNPTSDDTVTSVGWSNADPSSAQDSAAADSEE